MNEQQIILSLLMATAISLTGVELQSGLDDILNDTSISNISNE